MKRPLALVGFSFLIALIAAYYMGVLVSAIVGGVLLLAGGAAALARLRDRRPAAGLLAAGIACLVFAAVEYGQFQPFAGLDGQTVTVRATLVELSENRNGKYYYLLEASSFDGAALEKSCKIRLSADEPLDVQPYDELVGSMRLRVPENTPGTGFDAEQYYRSQGIALTATAAETPQVLVNTGRKPLYAYALAARQWMRQTLDGQLSADAAALARGILLGDTDGLSSEVTEDFRQTGVSHLLAVSGLHLTVLLTMLLWLGRRLFLRRRPLLIVAAALVALFMAVTGFPKSMLRAGLMCMFTLAGDFFYEEPDSLNSLGGAVLVILLFDPLAALDVGFQLSVASTFGLIALAPRMSAPCLGWLGLARGVDGGERPALWRRAGGWLVRTLMVPAAVTVCTLPVLALSFGTVSLISPVANFLLLYAGNAVLGAAAVLCLLAAFPLPGMVLAPVRLLCEGLARYMLAVTGGLTRVPMATASLLPAAAKLCVLFVLAAVALWALGGGRRVRGRLCALCCALVLCSSVLTQQLTRYNQLQISLWGTESSACVVLQRNGRAVILDPDGFSAESVARRLCAASGVYAVDCVLARAGDDGQLARLETLQTRLPVQSAVLLGGEKEQQAMQLFGSSGWSGCGDGIITVLDGLQVEVLFGDDDSCAMIVYYGDFTMLLCAGADGTLSRKLAARGQEFTAVYFRDTEASARSFLTERRIATHVFHLPQRGAVQQTAGKLVAQGYTYHAVAGQGVFTLTVNGRGDYRLQEGER